MNTIVKDCYVTILETQGYLTFEYDGFIFEINEGSEGGFMVEIYEPTYTDDDDIEAVHVDGGLCTGSERDAVEFMIRGE